MLILTVIQGPDKGRRFELPDDEPQQIGRSSEALPLYDQTISRRHAELTPDNGRWYIRDLGSSNGTYVNGVRVTQARMLQPGDQIRAGTSLVIYGEDPKLKRRSKRSSAVHMAGRAELPVSVESTVASSDDSMIMSSPDPKQSAEFQLNVIYELVTLIGNVTDKQELFEKVMEVVFGYFDADRGFILVGEEPGQRPEPVVVRRRHDAGQNLVHELEAKGKPITISRTIVKHVMKKGVGVLSSNAMADSRFASGDSVQGYGIRSAMCVPIKYKDRLYGVIQVDSKVANYTYTDDQLNLLTAIGVQTGLALANLRLVESRLRSERLAGVGQTVASLSHSIKNILQGLRGGADVVEMGLKKQQMKVIGGGWDIVSRNLERIYELTMNMLAYSKQRQPEFEMGNLPPLLGEVAALLAQQYENKKVALIQDYADDLPPMPLDAGGIHQAILNLLSNALDAVEPESGAVTLRADYLPDDEVVSIRITDNGEGMSSATLRRLFQPFQSSKGLKGTGLGLVVTKKIVEEHGGTITVRSKPKQGTTFTIRLPLNVRGDDAAATHGPAAAAT
jgi:signal transduction histidine kinase/pSer/pThr/pTyr-binding forkhead associated (FHA) protein